MAAEKGNKYWMERLDLSEDGRKLSVEDLKIKAFEYMSYCIENPIKEKDFRGKDAKTVHLEKPRAMIKEGLCVWLGIGTTTWDEWRKDEKYKGIVTRVDNLMYTWNFEHSAANLMNSSLIAKKLGLSDKKEIDIKSLKLGEDYEADFK